MLNLPADVVLAPDMVGLDTDCGPGSHMSVRKKCQLHRPCLEFREERQAMMSAHTGGEIVRHNIPVEARPAYCKRIRFVSKNSDPGQEM